MFKILLIVGLIGFFLYILYNRFVKPSIHSTNQSLKHSNGFYLLTVSSHVISDSIKKTITLVAIGTILLFVVLILAIKVKILLFLVPISIYLISHLFVLNSHIKHSKNQQIWFDPSSYNLVVEQLDGHDLHFNLEKDVHKVKEIKAVQETKGLMFGYYTLYLSNSQVRISYLYKQNSSNQFFFDALNQVHRAEQENKLFPII